MPSAAAPGSPAAVTGPRWLAALPTVLACLVLAGVLLPRVHGNTHLLWSFVGAGSGLLAWQAWLWWRASRGGRALRVEPSAPVRQHYVQACVQTCLYLYWGWFWQEPDGTRPIYAQAPLILAQFAWLYAFDALFAWSRGMAWRLGSGPTPIVLSTNLFIWFRDDWFAWQFVMVAVGLLGKAFVQWTKEGRRTHVFNPSGFGLAVAATVLIATGQSDLTWVKPLASTIDAVPGIFVFLFCLGLVVQHVFAVTLMTFAAALVMVAANLLYHELTSVWLFASSNLPAAAFLGLHLLMTDPSTSPRSNLGRTLFGAGYGLGYVIAFQLLGWLGAPELFAKLYPVPVLNCCVQWLDRLARGRWCGGLSAKWEGAWSPRRTNAVHMALWAAVFGTLLATGYFRADHPGNSIAFWKQAVHDGRHDAERKLIMVAGSTAVAARDPAKAGAAYNELGILSLASEADPAALRTRQASAAKWFGEAAARGSAEAVTNIVALFLYGGVHRADQELDRALRALEAAVGRAGDTRACQLLGLAHETGAARPLAAQRALELYRRCGDDLAAQLGIVRLALAPGSLVDAAPVLPALRRAADAGVGEACYLLAWLVHRGVGGAPDEAAARALLARAADLGFAPARAMATAGDGSWPVWTPLRRQQLWQPPWATAFPLQR